MASVEIVLPKRKISRKISRNPLLRTSQPIFTHYLHGVEREGLRVDETGHLALTPHPRTLGEPLTHPSITTDFSESQLECITKPHPSMEGLLKEITCLCHQVQSSLQSERFWSLSMPAYLPRANEIPLADYGNSPLGRQKHIYRRGLAHRYGAKMQTICSVHYNFSPGPQFWEAYFLTENKENNAANISEAYIALIRNLLRHIYIFPYLFGNSPALDKSFLQDLKDPTILSKVKKYLSVWRENTNTLYAEHSTSLRQTEIGYSPISQWQLRINYNGFAEYIKTMSDAVNTVYPPYQKWSVDAGEQLGFGCLQAIGEHYAPVRPKQTLLEPQQSMLTALQQRGIQYIELRCLDIQNGAFCGIDKHSLYFVQLLFYHCLLSPSPPLYEKEEQEIRENYLQTAWEGRKPNAEIMCSGKSKNLSSSGIELCNQLEELAQRLDEEQGCAHQYYQKSLALQREKFINSEFTPSAKSLQFMAENHLDHIGFGLQQVAKNEK